MREITDVCLPAMELFVGLRTSENMQSKGEEGEGARELYV